MNRSFDRNEFPTGIDTLPRDISGMAISSDKTEKFENRKQNDGSTRTRLFGRGSVVAAMNKGLGRGNLTRAANPKEHHSPPFL